jgi:hypothetical protein
LRTGLLAVDSRFRGNEGRGVGNDGRGGGNDVGEGLSCVPAARLLPI